MTGNVLEITGLSARYGHYDVLKGIDLTVREGEVVGLLGPNGAGKTTTLRAIMGLMRRRRGSIRIAGQESIGWPAHQAGRGHAALVPEGRRLFLDQSIQDNLELGAFHLRHDQRQTSASDIHPSDLSDLLGRFGIDLIAERIEGERAVVDLLDYDVRFGQGFLFAPPRPLRPEGASATGGAPAGKGQDAKVQDSSKQDSSKQDSSKTSDRAPDSNGTGKTASIDAPAIDMPRISGVAALARRIAGPG